MLILQRFVLIVKRINFAMMIKEKSNPFDTGAVVIGFLWELVIVASRCIIVLYSVLMIIWSRSEPQDAFTF